MTIRNHRFSLLKQPISSTLNQHLIDYPTPSNLSYWKFRIFLTLFSGFVARSFFVLICFYWLYTDFILLVFHVVHFDLLVATLGSQPLDFGLISLFDNGADSLPTLESESSSASLSTYRNEIAAESETEIYNRIRNLEHQLCYNIPPQNNMGDYERLVREHFDQALNVNHYLEIWDKEFIEVQLMEKKALLQDRLLELMMSEQKIERIMELSPYTDIRKEAHLYIQSKVEPVSSLFFPFQRNLMEGSLNSFIQDLNEQNRQSGFYLEFYRHFTDEEFRRSIGLPLP